MQVCRYAGNAGRNRQKAGYRRGGNEGGSAVGLRSGVAAICVTLFGSGAMSAQLGKPPRPIRDYPQNLTRAGRESKLTGLRDGGAQVTGLSGQLIYGTCALLL